MSSLASTFDSTRYAHYDDSALYDRPSYLDDPILSSSSYAADQWLAETDHWSPEYIAFWLNLYHEQAMKLLAPDAKQVCLKFVSRDWWPKLDLRCLGRESLPEVLLGCVRLTFGWCM